MKKLLIAFLLITSVCGAQTLTVPEVSAPSQLYFQAYNTSAQPTAGTIGTTTYTLEVDQFGMVATSTGVFTCPSNGGGRWVIGGHATWVPGAGDYRYLALEKGGVGAGSLPNYAGSRVQVVGGSNGELITISTMMVLSPGDIVVMSNSQNSGGSLNMNYAVFWGYKLP